MTKYYDPPEENIHELGETSEWLRQELAGYCQSFALGKEDMLPFHIEQGQCALRQLLDVHPHLAELAVFQIKIDHPWVSVKGFTQASYIKEVIEDVADSRTVCIPFIAALEDVLREPREVLP